jgi:hypothetical protein
MLLDFKFNFTFQIILIFAREHFSFALVMGIVDDQTAEYLAEIRRAMAASREEAGLPSSTTAAPSLEEIAAAVRESGLVGALNNIAATTISTSVSLYRFYFPGYLVAMFSWCLVMIDLCHLVYFLRTVWYRYMFFYSYLNPLGHIFVRFS